MTTTGPGAAEAARLLEPVARHVHRHLEDRRLVLEITLLRMAEAGRLPEALDRLMALKTGSVWATGKATAAVLGGRIVLRLDSRAAVEVGRVDTDEHGMAHVEARLPVDLAE